MLTASIYHPDSVSPGHATAVAPAIVRFGLYNFNATVLDGRQPGPRPWESLYWLSAEILGGHGNWNLLTTDVAQLRTALLANLSAHRREQWLALYDRDQAGVRRAPRPRDHSALVTDQSEPWVLLGSRGEIVGQHETAESFCTSLKRAIDQATLARTFKSLFYYNEPTIQRLRLARPELKTGRGVHYADLPERYAERAKQRLGQARGSKPGQEIIPPEPVDKSALLLGAPKRLRDPEHLKFINTQPCLICGRAPEHAHHLRFAQPRAMSNKVSDGWAVPLCFTHHRALHTVGNEEAWWVEKGIDAKAEALRLWRQSHGIAEPTEVEEVQDIAEGGEVHAGESPVAKGEDVNSITSLTGAQSSPHEEETRDNPASANAAAE